MNRTFAAAALIAGCIFFSSAVGLAHHSVAANFDANKPMDVVGKVKEVEIRNPHSQITLEVAKPGQPLPRTLHKRYSWKISTLTPRSATQPTLEGSNIEYWLEAEDNNDVTGPGEGESEHFSARVVSELEKRKEIFARLGN